MHDGPATPSTSRKPLFWMGSSLRDLKAMVSGVQKFFGATLRDVQYGETPREAKPEHEEHHA